VLPGGRSPEDPQWKLLLAMANVGAQAMARARLYEAERTARAEVEKAHARLARLQAVSDVALAHLDLDELLAHLLARVQSALGADGATVLLVSPDGGHLQVRSASGVQSEVGSQVQVPVGRGFAGHIAATRQPLIVPDVSSFPVVSPVLKQNVGSLMGVPLESEGRVLGVLHVGSREPREFTDEDIAFLRLAADRASAAIRKAQLYEERDRIARTLQESLLPGELPRIPGLELGAVYRAGGEGVEVGGDFYDVFDTGDGGWAAVIGDVCGKGAEAAALTSFARHTVRTGALRDRRPSVILELLNEGLLRQELEGRFCTIAYARVRPAPEGSRVTVSSGGHPLPVVLRADGRVETVGEPGTLLGLFEDVDLVDRPTDLGRGDALVMYTDGVVEGSLDGESALYELLSCSRGRTAQQIADAVTHAAGEGFERGRRDDMAVLVLRVPG
jgi:serine phosphatase RsbU (regulator of sigma subunit)